VCVSSMTKLPLTLLMDSHIPGLLGSSQLGRVKNTPAALSPGKRTNAAVTLPTAYKE